VSGSRQQDDHFPNNSEQGHRSRRAQGGLQEKTDSRDGFFISNEEVAFPIFHADDEERHDSQDQAWALKAKKIKNKQSSRAGKALQEEQLYLSKTKLGKPSGPQPALTLAQVQSQATLIPPSGKGMRQAFSAKEDRKSDTARERKPEGQAKSTAMSL